MYTYITLASIGVWGAMKEKFALGLKNRIHLLL